MSNFNWYLRKIHLTKRDLEEKKREKKEQNVFFLLPFS